MRLKTFSLLCLAALMAEALPAASAGTPAGRRIGCTDESNSAPRLVMNVDGEKAVGHYALPESSPEVLVVFGHGYGHTTFSWIEHMKKTADRGFAAVAMNYRGLEVLPDDDRDGLPGSRGWPAKKGAEDLLAATQMFDRSCPSIEKIIIMGVSMGANMAGLALAEAGRGELTKYDHAARAYGDDPLFDYWINVEGATNVTETYLEARAVSLSGNKTAVRAVEDIEAEMGGPFESNADTYRERTVVNRASDVAAAELDGVVMTHALNDGLVPYNQSREMAAALAANRVPSDFYTVTTRDRDSEGTDTTITSYASSEDERYVPLAGHASEKSSKHIVMNVAFDRLWDIASGGQTDGLERVVYGTQDGDEPNYVGAP
ncbi:MAG TPA: alpha/beta fold hydrolase [Actinomycetota bacterium]|nr:alpha/beta fold hydrolase [Actinomycetota bacterium]